MQRKRDDAGEGVVPWVVRGCVKQPESLAHVLRGPAGESGICATHRGVKGVATIHLQEPGNPGKFHPEGNPETVESYCEGGSEEGEDEYMCHSLDPCQYCNE
jgi:hypothetical protein